MKRDDDFKDRHQHLKDLTDEQLEARFWELANKLVDPLLQMGKEYTSPAIERSVLLRMGFSSIEAYVSVGDDCSAENKVFVRIIAGGVAKLVVKPRRINEVIFFTDLAHGGRFKESVILEGCAFYVIRD